MGMSILSPRRIPNPPSVAERPVLGASAQVYVSHKIPHRVHAMVIVLDRRFLRCLMAGAIPHVPRDLILCGNRPPRLGQRHVPLLQRITADVQPRASIATHPHPGLYRLDEGAWRWTPGAVHLP